MLKLYTNVITGKTYDENGDLFEDGMPQVFYKSTIQVQWQLCSETPDLAEGSDDTPETAWTKCTDYSQYAAVGAFLTADSDYIKRRQGTLSAAVSAGSVSTIEATVNDGDFDTVPSTGVIELFDSEGESEVVKYKARSIEDGVVTFTLVDGSTVERSYASGSLMDCSDEPLMQAALDGQNSDVSNGLFCFKIRAFSRKLHDLVAYSNTKEVSVMGLELAVFRIDSESNSVVDLERYEVDTFNIRTGLAETSANPPLTDDEANETVTLCNTLLAAGFSLQFSADGSSWHDTQVTTGETIDVFFRFRSAGSGGTWSNGIRLVKGDPGAKGDDGDSAYVYVRYASDNQGTGFSATPSDSLPYIGVLATTEEIETPSASDFTGLWVLFKGPKGDPGTPGTNGTRGTRTYFGTAVTGTSTTAAVFDTDIADAVVGDSYVNTSTLNYYECTLGGDDTTAKWAYIGALKGPQGDSRYLYIAYASSSSGANFSLTPSSNLKYVAVKNSDTEIASPSASDFTGLWQQYIGDPGASAYVYVAYASNSSGSNFSLTPSDNLKYRAEIHTTTPISSPSSSDFSGATWVKYLGDPGSNGTRGSRFNYGTSITGTSETPTAYATGISDSLINDAYVNTDTQNLYRCTLGGDASTALWAYVGSMKGDPAPAALEGVKLNGELLTPTNKVVDVEAVPMATTIPSPAETGQDTIFYNGEDSGDFKQGHTYKKKAVYSDDVITVSWSSTTLVLTKHGSNNFWDDGDGSTYEWDMSYTNGHWVLTGSGPSYTSPAADASSYPWDFSGVQWSGPMSGMEITPTITREASYEWDDITPSGNTKLNGKTIEPSADKSVNIMALPIAIDSMPTADADAQPFILYLGATGGGYSKGHLYERTKTIDDSSITVEINGLAVFMTGGSGTWSNQEVSPPMNLYYSSNAGAWILERGFSYTSPQCPSTTMPWDPAISGKTWNYQTYGSITPTFTDPTVYGWNDLGSILGA